MRIAKILLIGLVAWLPMTASTVAMDEAAPHWSYGGEHGPAHWGDVAPEDAVCGSGKSQSPINLSSGTAKEGITRLLRDGVAIHGCPRPWRVLCYARTAFRL